MTQLIRNVPVFIAGITFCLSLVARGSETELRTDGLLSFPQIAQPLVVSYDPNTASLSSLNVFLGGDRFLGAGVWGQGASAANIEAGHFWIGHESLSHVPAGNLFTGVGAVSDYSEHATAVAQVMAGLGPEINPTTGDIEPGSGIYSYRSIGMAPFASLYSGAIATSITTNSFDISEASFLSAYDHYFGAVDVINSSWGSSGDSSGADFYSVSIDALARANPRTTMVAAAGNEGPGSNTVGSPAAGFNVISVGALDPAHTYTQVASFSSRGPGDFVNPITNVTNVGVRATVDISAPGVNVGGAYTTNEPTAYYAVNGTSFAAPLVAGGATLMASASRILEANTNAVANGWSADARDARVIKAVLMNSADQLAGWSNNTVVSNGVEAVTHLGEDSILTAGFNSVAITQQGVDYEQGAGRMNLARAFEGYTSKYWVLDTVAPKTEKAYTFNGAFAAGDTLAATLVWYADRQIGSGYDYTDPDQVLLATDSVTNTALANLNLEIWDSAFTTLYATSRSLYNTVEHLVFQLPETQIYGLRVTFDDMIFGAAPTTETFALAWNVIPEPAAALLLPMSGLILFLRRRLKQHAA